jgi:hypothetical protein
MDAAEYELVFPPEYEAEESIWQSKGYVVVEVVTKTAPSRRFKVAFRDPTRLQQDIEAEFDDGRAAFAEANLVVVPQVTKSAIQAAIHELARRDFETLTSARRGTP